MKALLLLVLPCAALAQTGVHNMPPSTQFEVNGAALMKERPGQSGRQTKIGEEAGPATFTDGAMRITCSSAKMGFFDPLVHPGENGTSHLHNFFGNGDINYNTDTSNLGTSPVNGSTCAGGTINHSGYWVPAMIDTLTGFPIPARTNIVYYKSGPGNYYQGSAARLALITVPVPGLRMIAGNPANSSATNDNSHRWDCMNLTTAVADTSTWDLPVDCPADGNHELMLLIFFMDCWDGVNLDSPGHQSHMAYSNNAPCPVDHPVPIPDISFNIHWTIPPEGLAHWRLASDTYSLSIPAGRSAHGDWINGWEQVYLETIVNNCLHQGRDCHANLLGASPDPLPATANGYEMY